MPKTREQLAQQRKRENLAAISQSLSRSKLTRQARVDAYVSDMSRPNRVFQHMVDGQADADRAEQNVRGPDRGSL